MHRSTIEPQQDTFAFFPPRQQHYPDAPGFKERGGTSQAAAQQITPAVGILCEQVLACLRERPRTADEVAERIGRDRLAVRPRLSELAARGSIVKTGVRRSNDSGLSAAEWRAL